MLFKYQMTPWATYEEWQNVQRMLLSEDLCQAKLFIDAWRSRVPRLSAGVETTHSLLEAILDRGDSGLALSAAVNRFLNLITHAGMNMLVLTNYFDVATCFSIPHWIVNVRHDTNHGIMPSNGLLQSAVAFSLKWLLVNYWQFDDATAISYLGGNAKDHPDYEYIHTLLDCYRYLKIFAIWGNESLSELKEQTEIFELVSSFLGKLKAEQALTTSQGGSDTPRRKKQRRSKDRPIDDVDVKIRDSTMVMRNQIHKRISLNKNGDCQVIIATLCEDELLLPSIEVLDNLREPGETHLLPTNFIKVWVDVLSMLHHAGLLPKLLMCLLKQLKRASNDENQKQLARAWIEKLCEALTSKSTQRKDSGVILKLAPELVRGKLNDFVEESILSADLSLLSSLEIIGSLRHPPLTQDQFKRIHWLAKLYSDNTPRDAIPRIDKVYTYNDLLADEESNANVGSTWQKSHGHDWKKIPLGLCPGQTREDLNSLFILSDITTSSRVESFLQTDEDVVSVDWNELKQKRFQSNVDSQDNVPAFYRRAPQKRSYQ